MTILLQKEKTMIPKLAERFEVFCRIINRILQVFARRVFI